MLREGDLEEGGGEGGLEGWGGAGDEEEAAFFKGAAAGALEAAFDD